MTVTHPMRFEALIMDNSTVAKQLFFRPPYEEDIFYRQTNGRKAVYSPLTDTVLYVNDYSVSKDKFSTIYMFELSNGMLLITELFNLEMQFV